MPTSYNETKTWEEIYEIVYKQIGCKLNKVDKPIFKKWFMEREQVGYLFHAPLILRCFRIWQELKNNLDHFIVISGREGWGKSTLSFGIASWVHPNFDLDYVCYGAKSYLDLLSKQAALKIEDIESRSIVLDEGTELLSKESLNLLNRALTKTFFVQRALKFLVIVNIPNFHMLDTTIRYHRVRTLIEMIAKGSYKAITGKGIKIIAKEGMAIKEITTVRIPMGTFWRGSFSKRFPKSIDYNEYLKRKHDSIKYLLEELKDDIVSKKMIAANKVCKEIGVTAQTITRMIKLGKVEGKQIGGKWFLTRQAYDKLITV